MCTRTWLLGIPVKSTRTRIHGSNKLKIGRESQRSFGAADGHHFIFHRLAHHFEDARAKLGELVQEQDAAMRQGDLTRLRDIPATDQTRMRNCMMWCAKWAMPDQWCT